MTAATAAKPWLRRGTVLLGLAVALVVGFVATLVVRRELAARRLAAVIADLDRTDPGWRLDDLERARATVPDAENLAGALTTAAAKYTWPAAHSDWHTMLENDLPESNVRLARSREALARSVLQSNASAVPDALALADYPRGRHALSYAPHVVYSVPPHVERMCLINVHLLQPLGLLAVQDGDPARAVTVLRAQLNFGRSLRDEPIMNSQLMRVDCRRQCVRGLERLLGHAPLSAGQLADVRRELEAELGDDPWAVAMRGERAFADEVLNALRSGAAKASALKPRLLRNYSPTPLERVGDRVSDFFGPEVDTTHAFLLDRLTRVAATAQLPWPERLAAVESLCAEWPAGPPLAQWANHLDFPWRLALLVIDQVRLRAAIVAIAAEQYRLAHGDWPASLAALGPLPDDPFTGKPLLFKRTADGVVVYSVGPNGRDDGELAKDDGNIPKGGDVGFRLWDVPQRNRPPVEGVP